MVSVNPKAPNPTSLVTPWWPGFADIAAPPRRRRRSRDAQAQQWTRRISRGFAIFAIFFILLGRLASRSPRRCRNRWNRSHRRRSPCSHPMVRRSRASARSSTRRSKTKDLPRHVTGAFLAIEDRRFYSALGDRSAQHRARGVEQCRRRADAGRQHDHAAAREIHLPFAQTDAGTKGARGADRLPGSKAWLSKRRDPRTLSVERLFRRQYLWPARRVAPLFLPPSPRS